MAELKTVLTPDLNIAYLESGDPGGIPIVLLHGFPDDALTWNEVAAPLAGRGHRVLVPYLRGYGPTRFRNAEVPRMAQQAAIGQDLLDFLAALKLPPAALAGYDWGGRAACIATLLAPERVRGLVTIGGYNVQNTVAPSRPVAAERERAYWYQWYFNTERGRAGLEKNRRDICKLLWQEWSPGWRFDDTTFEATAKSFDNQNFVEVVIHSYRHRHRNAPGEPRFEAIEHRLAERPSVTVPSVVLHGAEDTVDPPRGSEGHMSRFPAGTERRLIERAGHFMPRERPDAIVDALLRVLTKA
jgi:pimeloyl-ACP methyl ester carboxylesterase